MKLSNIISTSLLENDDDMFPGADSSVFDEVPNKDTKDIGWMDGQIANYISIEKVYSRKRWQLLDDMDRNGARVYIGPDNPPGPGVIPYSSFDWFDDSNLTAGMGKYRGIEKSSPYLKDIENTVRTLHKYYKRESIFKKKKSEMFTAKMDMTKGM